MDDLARRFGSAQRAFTDRVRAVGAGEWQLATPAEDWTVADLVAHLVYEHRWVPPVFQGLDLEAAARVVDDAGPPRADPPEAVDYPGAWDDAAVASLDAVSAEGALDRTVHLARGATPAAGYVAELIFDLVVHAWDLGRAIAYTTALPGDMVEAVWAESKTFGDLSSSGLFDSPVEIPDDSPTVDRLVAMTGRDPR